MANLNRVQLIGTLGRDPETKTFNNGGSVCNFSIATSERWNDKNTGEKKEETTWHNISINGKLGEVAQQYLKKGSQVYLEGKIKIREYEKDGQKRQAIEINCNQMQMLDRPQQSGQQQQQAPQAGGYGKPSTPVEDDALPF